TTTQDFTLGYATISVAPGSLSQTLLPGATATQMLTISNTGGTEPLTWSAAIEFLQPDRQYVSIPAAQQVTSSAAPSRHIAEKTSSASSPSPSEAGVFEVLRGSTGYGFDMYPGNDFITFDTDTPGVYSFSAPTTHTVFAADFDQNNVFYAIDNASSQLFTVDVATGAFTLVGSTLALTDLAFDYTTNTMYAVNYDATSSLYTLDLATGATTLVGDCGAGLIISLACDGLGNLYGFNISDDALYSINKLTGAKTLIGAVGFDGNYAQSMAWDPASDIIYMAAYNNTAQQGQLRVVDKVTGATSLVGAFPAGAEVCGLGFMGATETWLTIDPISGVINPGESQDITVTFDATDLVDSTYLANININHNGQELTDGTVVVPVSMIVASASAPEPPTEPAPPIGATMVSLQPEFSWINGAGTAQVQLEIRKGTGGFASLVYKSPWFTGTSFNLADVPLTLLPKQGYSWYIKAKNAAGITTSPRWIFTTIGVGSVNGVVTDAYSTLPLEGATITIEPGGYTATTSNTGSYSIPDVLEGTYTVTAEMDGYVSESMNVVVVHNQTVTASFALDLYLEPPFGLQAHVVDNTDVHLMWQSPGSGFAPEWLTFSGETITNSIGTNAAANFDVAARFTPDMLAGFPGGSLTKIQFVPGEPDITCTYTLKVWEGVSPPTLIYSQVLPGVTADVWNEVVLTTPVPVDITKELWFGFNCNTTAGYPAGCDDGPHVQGFGNMMFWNGSWTTLTALNDELTFNWAVKGYVESAKGGALLEPLKATSLASANQGNLSLNPVASKPTVSLTPGNNSRALLGFNVYRNGDFLVNTELSTTEYDDLNLAGGTYAYTVKAVYDQGESEAVGPKTVAILPPPVLLAAEPDFYGVDLLWQAGTNYPTDNLPGIYSTSNVKPAEKKRASASLPYSAGRAIGDNCTDPIIIGALPYTDANTTCGRGNYTDTTCLGNYDGGEDIFYKLTLAAETYVSITMETAVTWTGMLLTDECPPGAECIAISTNTGAGGSQIQQLLAAGTYYIMIDTYPTPNCIDAFTITVEEYEPCVVDCPPGALAENEPCGEDLNGGCNADVPAYTPIAIGDTYCGTAYADAGRDTDWYELVLDTPQVLTWAVTAEFPVLAFIIDGNNGCDGLAILQSATAATCETATVTATVAPGTYWLWVGNQAFEGNPCGTSNNYVATLTAEETFLSYYNVYRDGVEIAEVYGNTYYDDVDITNGEEYCYTVSEVVAEGLETAMS
ncbi:hypothetical protein EOM75_13790, partial [Candidatus Falkowbacteria bacterium]|nr:hypothetical protein [Candidatus Falkowbacteria bacterium]